MLVAPLNFRASVSFINCKKNNIYLNPGSQTQVHNRTVSSFKTIDNEGSINPKKLKKLQGSLCFQAVVF